MANRLQYTLKSSLHFLFKGSRQALFLASACNQLAQEAPQIIMIRQKSLKPSKMSWTLLVAIAQRCDMLAHVTLIRLWQAMWLLELSAKTFINV
jgi:hypothetical protein